MFRISTLDTRTERRLVVEGKLVQPWIDELKKCWHEAAEGLDGRKLVIDLGSTTHISDEGKDALQELMQEGARFSCAGVLTKYVLRQLAQRFRLCGEHVNRKPNNGSEPATPEVDLGTRESCS